MSMQIHVDEGQICEAIVRGDVSLSEIVHGLEFECGSHMQFADHIADDVSRFLDRFPRVYGAPRRVLDAIEEAALQYLAEEDDE